MTIDDRIRRLAAALWDCWPSDVDLWFETSCGFVAMCEGSYDSERERAIGATRDAALAALHESLRAQVEARRDELIAALATDGGAP